MRNGQIRVTEQAYHRNGVHGAGFTVCLFDWKEPGRRAVRHMMAILHGDLDAQATTGYCSVLDREMLAEGNIGYENRWRGDDFEVELQKQCRQLQEFQL